MISKTNFKSLLFFIVFIISFFVLSQNLLTWSEKKAIHEDELTFISRGKFLDWYLSGDFNRKEWQQYESFDVPKLGEYFYGLFLRIHSGKTVIDYLSESNFYKDGGEILGFGREVLEETRNFCCSLEDSSELLLEKAVPILIARKFAIFFFALPSILLIFLIARKVAGNIFALVSIFLIASNGLFIESMVTAMGEAPLWFFSLLFLYISLFYFVDLKIKDKKEKYIVLLGIIAGLATAIKMNGVILLFFFFSILIYLFFKKIINKKELIKKGLMITVSSYLVFFLLNPFLWKNPLLNSLRMVEHRYRTFEIQKEYVDRSEYELDSLGTKFTVIFKRTLAVNGNYTNFNLEKWNGFYELPIDLILVLGSFYLLVRERKEKSFIQFLKSFFYKNNLSYLNVLLGFLLVFFVTTAINIPLDWDRYYLPFVFVWGYLQAYFISFCLRKIFD